MSSFSLSRAACYARADERRVPFFPTGSLADVLFWAWLWLTTMLVCSFWLPDVVGNQKRVWPTAGMRHSFIVPEQEDRRVQSFLLILPKREFMWPAELGVVRSVISYVANRNWSS